MTFDDNSIEVLTSKESRDLVPVTEPTPPAGLSETEVEEIKAKATAAIAALRARMRRRGRARGRRPRTAR